MRTVYIDWEHGDADTNITEKYSFKLKEDLDAFLRFIYDLRCPMLNKGWNGRENEPYWSFEDGHYQRETSWVEKINKEHGDKFVDLIPSDIHFSNYRPGINHIHIRIKNKKHYIVWLDILHKSEYAINLPLIGHKTEVHTGEICGHHKIFKIKYAAREYDLRPILGEGVGEYPDTVYPKIKAELVDCRVDFESASEYNFDYTRFDYLLLYKILDQDLVKKVGHEYVVTQMKGFDPDFEKKFNHAQYDGLPAYEIKR